MSGKRKGKRLGLAARMVARLGRPVVRRLSDLAAESLKEPGSWRCLEMVYRNQPRKLLDRVFLGSRAARGARNRLRVIGDELCKLVEERAKLHNPVRVISFGSGPGHEVLGCIERLRGMVGVQAVCMDKEPGAIKYGRVLAAQKGLQDNVRYLQGNVLRLNSAVDRHDIGILSGLLDYFDFEAAVSVLRRAREMLLPEGTVLIANMRRHGLASVMRTLGNWKLIYREPVEVEKLLETSGFQQVKVWLESERVFSIGMGVRPS